MSPLTPLLSGETESLVSAGATVLIASAAYLPSSSTSSSSSSSFHLPAAAHALARAGDTCSSSTQFAGLSSSSSSSSSSTSYVFNLTSTHEELTIRLKEVEKYFKLRIPVETEAFTVLFIDDYRENVNFTEANKALYTYIKSNHLLKYFNQGDMNYFSQTADLKDILENLNPHLLYLNITKEVPTQSIIDYLGRNSKIMTLVINPPVIKEELDLLHNAFNIHKSLIYIKHNSPHKLPQPLRNEVVTKITKVEERNEKNFIKKFKHLENLKNCNSSEEIIKIIGDMSIDDFIHLKEQACSASSVLVKSRFPLVEKRAGYGHKSPELNIAFTDFYNDFESIYKIVIESYVKTIFSTCTPLALSPINLIYNYLGGEEVIHGDSETEITVAGAGTSE